MPDPVEVTKPTDERKPPRSSFAPSFTGRPRFSSDSYDGGGSGYGGGYEGSIYDEEGTEGRRRYAQVNDRSRCRFCREKLLRVDYKDVLTLQKLCTGQGRIYSRKRSGNCAAHQRMVKDSIKQARFIGLLPYTV